MLLGMLPSNPSTEYVSHFAIRDFGFNFETWRLLVLLTGGNNVLRMHIGHPSWIWNLV